MPLHQKIWKIDNNKASEVVEHVVDEQIVQEILCAKIEILNEGWFLIGRNVLTAHNKYIDLLAIDGNGNLIIIELKRDKTPRDVVAQAIDYATWVKGLQSEDILEIYKQYSQKYVKDGLSFDEVFKKKFNIGLDEESINNSHQMIIVASIMDSSTERIVQYLTESNIPINVLFFKIFKEGDATFLSRTWLIQPTEIEENAISRISDAPWNGEYYVSFGEFDTRMWEDAVKYGFISAGGGTWYSQTLNYLQPGDRIWVNIPRTGYVGVGKVEESVNKADKVFFEVNGQMKNIYEITSKGNYMKDYIEDEDKAEYIVKVKWVKTVSKEKAIRETGFFGNQNTVCKPTSHKWNYTVNRLKEIWGIK